MFNNIVCFLILLFVLFVLYLFYNNYYYFTCDYNTYSEEFQNNNDNYFNLKHDTPMGYNMEKIICSKECCSTQWPTSVNIKDPKINMKDYLPTNLSCNDGIHDTGCVCKKNI